MNWGSDWYLKFPIAHRGYHQGDEVPENSLASFKACIEKKLPIELDVHILTDGTALVFHDDTFERMTGYHKDVYISTYSEVANLKLLKSEEKVPTLQDVLALVDGQVPLVIELKCLKHDGRLEHQVHNLLRSYHGPYSIQSFNPYTLLWFKRYAPAVTRGFLSGSYHDSKLSLIEKLILKSMVMVLIIKPHYIGMESSYLWSPMLRLANLFMKIPIVAWCITSKAEAGKLPKFVSNIIFEGFDPS